MMKKPEEADEKFPRIKGIDGSTLLEIVYNFFWTTNPAIEINRSYAHLLSINAD